MEVFVGTIMSFGFNFPPYGWALCIGQTLPISQNTALFSLLGTQFGGNGTSTFQLPDLQGRTAIGQGTDTVSKNTYVMGEEAGSSVVTLMQAQLPAHTHAATAAVSIPVYSDTGNTANPSGNSLATPGASSFSNQDPDVALKPFNMPVTIQVAGGSQPVSVQNPFLVLNYSIALYGVFPARN